jgi:hypothetical protein
VDDTRVFDWSVEAGERETLTIPVLRLGVPFSVTGRLVDAAVKTRPGGAVLYTFPVEGWSISVDGFNVELVLPAAVTAAFAFTSAYYRVKVVPTTPTDPDVQRLLQGAFLVSPD